ncbi:MAG TPA: hypothetical protein VE442_12975 [Jatrophihabitans sp.]|jgi:hypothetical protein|nr:hypothetical protein [Jatrophihabitans sp.]
MTIMPEGAQISRDGYWWDGSAQQWRPVEQPGAQDSAPHQLLNSQALEDWFQYVSIDPQVLHVGQHGELVQQLNSEFELLRHSIGGGDLLKSLSYGASGTSFVELLKQLAEKLHDAGDSNADRLDELASTVEQDLQQLLHSAG